MGWMNPEVFDFGRTIRDQFGGQILGKSIEVVNLAKPSAPVGYAVEVLSEVDDDASLVVVYSGHNEFMHFKDKDDEITLISEPRFSAADRRRTLTQYESSLEEIVSHMSENGTPIILFTAASNVADWAPTLSILESTENASRVRGLLDEAEGLYASGQYADALGAFLEVTDLEPGFAWGNFRAADVYRRLGNLDEAKSYYRRASSARSNASSASLAWAPRGEAMRTRTPGCSAAASFARSGMSRVLCCPGARNQGTTTISRAPSSTHATTASARLGAASSMWAACTARPGSVLRTSAATSSSTALASARRLP
jgi:tetratricopeptide (TPR) repeat protein